VIGHARHGHGILYALAIPASQGDAQDLGCQFSVFKEHLIKIPHAVEEHCVRVLLLKLQVLPQHGGEFTVMSPPCGAGPQSPGQTLKGGQDVVLEWCGVSSQYGNEVVIPFPSGGTTVETLGNVPGDNPAAWKAPVVLPNVCCPSGGKGGGRE